MSDSAFEQLMRAPRIPEYEYQVYDQDVCIGSVTAVSNLHAETLARLRFKFNKEAPMYLLRVS